MKLQFFEHDETKPDIGFPPEGWTIVAAFREGWYAAQGEDGEIELLTELIIDCKGAGEADGFERGASVTLTPVELEGQTS